MTIRLRLLGDNNVMQIDNDHQNLAFISKHKATAVSARFSGAPSGHMEFSDTGTSRGERLYAVRGANGQYVRFLRGDSWYYYTPPSGVSANQQIWIDNSEDPTADVLIYIFDLPMDMPPSGILLRIKTPDASRVAFDSREKYMDVADTLAAVQSERGQVDSVSLPNGTYAILPLSEAMAWEQISCWDDGGGITRCDYYDSVTWWRTTATGGFARLTPVITEAGPDTVQNGGTRACALIVNVTGL